MRKTWKAEASLSSETYGEQGGSVGYISLARERAPVARTIVLEDEQINIDIDKEGRIVGIEVLDARILPKAPSCSCDGATP